jgi:membrane protein YdbS with pleckstrin-like domain
MTPNRDSEHPQAGDPPAVDPARSNAPGIDILPRHPALKTVWRLRNLVLSLAAFVPVTALASAALPGDAPLALALAVVVALMIFGWWHAGAAFDRYRVAVLDDGVRVEKGVFWRVETFVPGVRIQHTEVNQGPLDRRWGMAKLVIHTAAAGLASVSAVGLHRDDAIAVRDRLLDRGHDAV